MSITSALGVAVALWAAGGEPALAHTGMSANGFGLGVAHPFSGVDHLLAMVAVGLFAAQLGGAALWIVPAGFVAAMAAGGALGAAGVGVGPTEAGIALSLVAFGLALAAAWRWPVVAAALFVAVFGVFHGHAHGAETPADAQGLAYGAGFLLATAALHAGGVALGLVTKARPALRLAGVGVASVGAVLLIGL
ncbi:MAG: HupE/UreJ family protein [Methylobacteriaceae bacterium]|nr:HupE/UreJ family protein [Methylobacteriaceae bacterium]